ncbi:MAG TPA: hypothetical protein VFA26_21315, partial [Gemmataceae bacterium]|nr:hypothetical protein [Gemmataceae bacterium]
AVLGWRGGWRVLGAAALTLALAGGLVLGSDHYYRGRLTHSPTASHFGDRPVDDGPFFRPAEGARAALARNPLALSPQGTVAVPAQPLAHLLGWQEMLPQRLATWAALALGAMAILAAAVARRRGPLPQGVGPLAGLVAACFLLGLALKYLSTFAAEGLSPTIPDAVLLRLYLYSQALRLELLLLLPLAGAGAAALYLLADQGRPARRTLAAAVAATAAVLCCTWLLISPLLPLVVAPAMIFHGHVNPDDLELVAWIDAHLPADGGLIAPACETYVGGLNEKVIVAFDGGMALPMYSRRYDLAFSYWGDRNKSHDDYLAHVKDRLDADWCRANGIRYFYVTPAALHLTRQDGPLNPGLARAIAEGRLRVVHQCGESVLYEVAEGR